MTLTLEKLHLENSTMDGWPSTVDMKVILPGLVRYEDLVNSKGERATADVLVTKEALDKMANSLEGKPIINWDHRKVSPEDFKKGRAQGIIIGPAVFNSTDGWYHAKGLVWDDATRKNIENGYSISCAYTVSEWGDGPGTHNQVPYEREVRNGTYTHIAVVPTPRYENARIELLNSKGGVMGFLSLFRKDKPEEKIEVDMTTPVAVDGLGEVPLETLANSYKAAEAKKQELLNKTLEDDRLIEIDGKKISIKELKNAHKELVNAEESIKMMNAHKAGEHKNALANCAMCNAADKDEKDEKEKKDRENSTRLEEERKNSAAKAKEEAAANAAKLDELRNKGGKVEMPKVQTLRDLQAEGEARYGVKPELAVKK